MSKPTKLPKQNFIPLTNSKQSPFTNLLQTYFNFTYIIFLSPFRFKLNHTGNFEIKKSLPQQCVCLITSLSVLLYRLDLYYNHSYQKSENKTFQLQYPSTYLESLSSFFQLLYIIRILTQFWFQTHHFLNIVQFLSKSEQYFTPQNNFFMRNFLKNVFLVPLFCLYTLIGIYYTITINWENSFAKLIASNHSEKVYLFFLSLGQCLLQVKLIIIQKYKHL